MEVKKLVTDMTRVIKVLYGSLHRYRTNDCVVIKECSCGILKMISSYICDNSLRSLYLCFAVPLGARIIINDWIICFH